MPLRLSALGLVAVLIAFPSTPDAADAPDYARVNESLAARHIVPRYERLAKAGQAFHLAVAAMCNSAPSRNTDAAQAAFHEAMDAWMGIEHVHHGPVELFMRRFRIHYWPDRGSRGARQIRQLLAGKDMAALEPDRFRAASVAVQGLPAAERLLFEDPGKTALIGGDGDFVCRLLGAIAFNIADMSAGIKADWTGGPSPFLREIREPGGPDARYESHKAVTAELVKGFHTSLITITYLKLDRVLGKTPMAAVPRRAESWRSGRALRNIVRNLEALQAMYEGEGGPGLRALVPESDAALADLLSDAFRQTLATARSIQVPLARAVVDPAVRPGAEQLAKESRALKQLVGSRLAPALGTPLGFNALDGD